MPAQKQKPKPNYVVEIDPEPITQKIPKSNYRVQTNRGMKTLKNYQPETEQEIQDLANQRQQTIHRYFQEKGKAPDQFTPEPPKAVQLFIESPEGDKTLLNSIDTPSDDFIIKCENYADQHQISLVIHYPDSSSRYIPPMKPEQRQRNRKNPPTLKGCRRCGSISCGTGTTKASPQCKPIQKDTPAPEPAKDTDWMHGRHMTHATKSWQKAAIIRCFKSGVYNFNKIVEITQIPADEALPIYCDIRQDESSN